MIQESYTTNIRLFPYVTIGEKDDTSPNRSLRVWASRSRGLSNGLKGPLEDAGEAQGELAMSAVLTEIDWETVEENLSMLTDETLERFLKRIIQIKMTRASTAQVRPEAFE